MWQTQEKTDRPRDHELEREYQDVMRQRGLFGLHVHVGGVDNKELTIQLINQLRTWVSPPGAFQQLAFLGRTFYRYQVLPLGCLAEWSAAQQFARGHPFS
jgi:hypothetical protein